MRINQEKSGLERSREALVVLIQRLNPNLDERLFGTSIRVMVWPTIRFTAFWRIAQAVCGLALGVAA